ncbi:MAG: hypothetical protein ABSH06_01050 [Thermodesulfobacteriota bacterium]
MESIQSRLRELAESTTYRKDFNDLKKSILRLKSLTHKEKDRFFFFNFVKIDPTKSVQAKIFHWTIIPLKEVQSLLKDGNINEHYVEIPFIYEDFKTKYGLNFFYDPAKSYQKLIFNLFVSPLFWSFGSDTDGTKIKMTVDISYPSRVLKKMFELQIKSLKKMWRIKEQRRKRIPDDEIFQMKKLKEEGLNDTEIFYKLYPELKGEIGRSYFMNFEAIATHERIKRRIKKAKELKP